MVGMVKYPKQKYFKIDPAKGKSGKAPKIKKQTIKMTSGMKKK